ncbi:MAG TPA: hypothetical protein VIO38_10925, partial [Rariglobus sp.]
MGRPLHSFLLGAVSAALIFFTAPPASAAPPRNPASSSSTYIKVGGVNYVDARVFLARFGFKAAWIERGRSLRFQTASARIDLEADKRDTMVNGLR